MESSATKKESGKRTLFVVLLHQTSHPYLGVVRLGDDASVRCPEDLRFENDFLEVRLRHSIFAIRKFNMVVEQ